MIKWPQQTQRGLMFWATPRRSLSYTVAQDWHCDQLIIQGLPSSVVKVKMTYLLLHHNRININNWHKVLIYTLTLSSILHMEMSRYHYMKAQLTLAPWIVLRLRQRRPGAITSDYCVVIATLGRFLQRFAHTIKILFFWQLPPWMLHGVM